MSVVDRHELFEPAIEPVIEAATRDGFALVQYETPTGQVVWEWRRGDEPRPQFVTRRVALIWMEEWLSHSV